MSVAVLQVIAGLDPAAGGPPASAVATAIALREQGVSNEIAFPVERGREDAVADFVTLLQANDIDVNTFYVSRLFGRFGRRWGISFRLAFWLLRSGRRFDVIHAHSTWTFPTLVGVFVAKVSRRATALSPHESLTNFDKRKSPFFRRTIKRLLRWTYVRSFDIIVVASSLEQGDMGDRASERAIVVPHAVMDISPSATRVSTTEELHVGFLGRLHPKKNLEVLIDALAALPECVSLHVAGTGPCAYRAALISRANRRGVADRIRWCGFVDSSLKGDFLASIDVLVMPSAFESFGVAAAEALTAGVPVVVSPHVGIADTVVRHGCGRVVPADPSQLADVLAELLRNSRTRQELTQNARVAAVSEFSSQAHGERIALEYERVLGLPATLAETGA